MCGKCSIRIHEGVLNTGYKQNGRMQVVLIKTFIKGDLLKLIKTELIKNRPCLSSYKTLKAALSFQLSQLRNNIVVDVINH